MAVKIMSTSVLTKSIRRTSLPTILALAHGGPGYSVLILEKHLPFLIDALPLFIQLSFRVNI